MLENNLTTVQISKNAKKLLIDIAGYFHRSQTGQIEWWIETEHRRIFTDGDVSSEPEVDKVSSEQQP